MKTLLLKLAGPLQSWGTHSHFEVRNTDPYPSKSAIIGLIAAAYGYRREGSDEDIERLNRLDFAVRIDQPGNLLQDFHTAHPVSSKGDIRQAYVTRRYYLQDAIFVVALGGDDEFIDAVLRAVSHPYFQGFLGRRSLPLLDDFILDISGKGVIEAIQSAPWQAADWYKKKHRTSQYDAEIYADANLAENQQTFMARDRAVSFSQQHRLHGFRPVVRIREVMSHAVSETDHDVFSSLGGE
ncbi:type I-E CRISPR-associated protein Cas5/CasD [Bifidobacterium aquikefiricola]|uniref:Type I-E CRISPR-associated protein Cas5/CasD n=1 Tax=Bifidobacterium aquikefiricola TaxID=3059038 RepID=A0AB39U4U6_9BIFI